MRLLAIDFGTKKCGIAMTDPLLIIASPLKVIFYQNNDLNFLINEIKKIIDQNHPFEKIILGFPLNADKSLSPTSKAILKFKNILMKEVDLPIILVDERYSTKTSLEVMNQMNLSIKDKKELKDALAAQKILEYYLQTHKS